MKRRRIDQIAELLDKRGKLSLDQLSEFFPDVSQMTLRRDLLILEQQEKIIRVRGGAMSVAASLIDENCSLFLDGGTTAMYLAKELPDCNIHVFTNGLAVAVELAKKKNIDVTMFGGQVLKDNLSTASPAAKAYFDNTNFELAIMSASAFTPENGFSCGSQIEADLLKQTRKKAKATYMMLDSSKIGKIMPYTFARMEDIDVLITDDDFPEELKQSFVKQNIVVM